LEHFTCLESDDVQKSLDIMASHQVRRIPVIDHNRRMVGIIAQGDVGNTSGRTGTNWRIGRENFKVVAKENSSPLYGRVASPLHRLSDTD
jgi:CBS-domain-containing membrane protein